MKILKFMESFGHELHYSAFDIDDNLFHMPTVIHLEKKINDEWVPTDVSTSEFASVRGDTDNYRLLNNNTDDAFCEFRDVGPRGSNAFLEDLKEAVRRDLFGPSWDAFVECLKNGNIFSWITARGNEPNTLRKASEYLIDNVISDDIKYEMYNNCLKHSYLFDNNENFSRIPKGQISQTPLIQKYLDSCDFYGVSSDSFRSEFGNVGGSMNPEKAKELALDKFIEKCNNFGRKINAKSVSIGFSDDDIKNVNHVETYFKEKSALSTNLPHQMKLNLYQTTDRTIKGGQRKKFHKVSESAVSQGMEGSVVPFSKFTSMQSRLFPKNDMGGDPYAVVHNLGVDHLSEISKGIRRKGPRRTIRKKKYSKPKME